jgi:hypothetical protein
LCLLYASAWRRGREGAIPEEQRSPAVRKVVSFTAQCAVMLVNENITLTT